MSAWKQVPVFARAAGLLADPHYEWARKTDFAYYGETEWLPVLLELNDPPNRWNTATAFAELVFEMQARDEHGRGWADHLLVPRIYLSTPRRSSKPTKFLAVLARKKFLDDAYLGNLPVKTIRRFEVGRATKPSAAKKPPPGGRTSAAVHVASAPHAVVTGVIDDGIAFAHDQFQSSDGTTRIESFWDQLEPSNAMDGDWGYGREITKRDPIDGIDARIGVSRHNTLVDEDEVYRRSGHVDHAQLGHKPLASRVSHGTHVMDLGCVSSTRPVPGQRPIVAVQLPVATVADPSGATLGPQVYNGLRYVIDKAESIAGMGPQLPVVVNVSYGTIAGPHDGSGVLEAAIDDLIDGCHPPVRVVLPAGNSHLSRCHARFGLAPGQSRELRWRVLPDDWTESHVEIWLPGSTDVFPITITITAPDGNATDAFFAGSAREFYYSGGAIVGYASYYPPGAAGNGTLVRLSLAPTGSPAGGIPLAPAGLWRIKVDNALGMNEVGKIHAWIQRDDTAPGYRQRGRQSYFDDPQYARYDDGGRPIEDDSDLRTSNSYVKREGTLNAIATGKQPIVIGGFRRSDGDPARYTGCGPVVKPSTTPSDPDAPHAMFPCEDAPSQRGILAAATRSNSCAAMFGTSVSAPLAAYWVAQRLASNQTSDRRAVFDYAQVIDTRPEKPSAHRGGGGRIPVPTNRRGR
jgi:Subtilase family